MNINDLFAAYCQDHNQLEPLLTAARRLALRVTRNEDFAQQAITDLWTLLPNLDLPVDTSFYGWLMTRLRWRSLDGQRRTTKEIPPPTLEDEDGNALTDDETLGALAFHHSAPVEISDIEDRIAAIPDPFVRQVADLMLDGLSQKEIANQVGVGLAALKKRLQRFRESQGHPALLAA